MKRRGAHGGRKGKKIQLPEEVSRNKNFFLLAKKKKSSEITPCNDNEKNKRWIMNVVTKNPKRTKISN